jgi:aminoglycoside phosphotransferase (APT) family kinase protein
MEERATASESIIDVLCSIHEVDVDAVGLGDLGRRDGYIERQLNRWYGQWEKSKTRELESVEEVYRQLLDRIPTQGPATIVHGDYRLDNCMLAPAGGPAQVIAVLDWEICTLGDPLADVGLLMVYWGDRAKAVAGVPGAPTLLDGFADQQQLLDRYADRTGRDLSAIDFYVAFGYWKLACIVEGVYARYIGGAMGERDKEAFAPFAAQVELLADLALDRVRSLT